MGEGVARQGDGSFKQIRFLTNRGVLGVGWHAWHGAPDELWMAPPSPYNAPMESELAALTEGGQIEFQREMGFISRSEMTTLQSLVAHDADIDALVRIVGWYRSAGTAESRHTRYDRRQDSQGDEHDKTDK